MIQCREFLLGFADCGEVYFCLRPQGVIRIQGLFSFSFYSLMGVLSIPFPPLEAGLHWIRAPLGALCPGFI
jgi:hypothetical protein